MAEHVQAFFAQAKARTLCVSSPTAAAAAIDRIPPSPPTPATCMCDTNTTLLYEEYRIVLAPPLSPLLS